MRTDAPPLLPIFRSRLQGELLANVVLAPEKERSLTELAHRLGASLATVQREVRRLESAGIIRSRRVGNTRLVSANQDSSLYAPLAELVLKTFGPVEAIGQHLAKVSRILKAYIFGSWAARYLGEPGGPPKDIDVLVIGNPDRDALFDAVLRAERQLGMPVNATVRSAYQWNDSPDGFIKQVRSSALVPLPINPGEKE